MKVNEAPEKIYLQENTTTDCYGEFWPEWFEARAKDSDIEYIRKDVFIEKIANFLNYVLDDVISVSIPWKLIPELTTRQDFIEHFKKYMEGCL